MIEENKKGPTDRVKKLLKKMEQHSWKDRSTEWFTPDQFKDIGKEYPDEPVIVRRALAIQEMLMTMTDKKKSENTHTYEIHDDELIVGVIALGSLGLGKAFPNYLTEDEKRVASVTSKTEMALFGHNSVNYRDLLKKGLIGIIKECDSFLADVEKKINSYENLLKFFGNLEQHPTATYNISTVENDMNAILAEESEGELGFRLKTYDTRFDDLFKLLPEFLKKAADSTTESNRYYVQSLKKKLTYKRDLFHDKKDFYNSVKIACTAVIEYAGNYAALAEKTAATITDPKRKAELLEISRVCRKVPAYPAESFHEALQGIYFYHLAQQSCMNQLSLGRLDQSLQPFYREDKKTEQLELFECFLIKCAERLILDSQTFVKQDHLDFGSNLMTTPVDLDQWAEANEFLQNIIIGGLTQDGKDAVNDCTFLILEAFQDTSLYTPTLNARINKFHLDGSSSKFLKEVAKTIFITKNGMPVIGNDEAVVKAMINSGIPLEEANDYVIDGCWEPLLNGTGDWTFRMFNMLTTLECALNGGATLSSNQALLRGQKLSYKTPVPDEPSLKGYENLQKILKTHIRFFTDQAANSIYSIYLIDQAINPTPLYSALLEGCMQKGRDKTWGGAKYRLGGIIAAGVPDTINTIAALKKWVYMEKEFKFSDVTDALRSSFNAQGDKEKQCLFDTIKKKFQEDSPKFGNNDPGLNDIMKWLLDTYYECVQESKKLAEEIFLKKPLPKDEKRITGLRYLAGYSGKSMEEEFGKDFEIKMTAGFGTFELFVLMGDGNAASADREKAGAPLARNFAPQEGTVKYSASHLLSSFKNIGLNRFAGGVITDICLEENDLAKDPKVAEDQIAAIIDNFVKNGGNMMTLTISDKEKLLHIYNLCENARNGDEEAQKELHKYEHVNVRVAGYQAPFITLPSQHQLCYIQRPVPPSC